MKVNMTNLIVAFAFGLVTEASIATVVTTLVWLALPRAYQKPLG